MGFRLHRTLVIALVLPVLGFVAERGYAQSGGVQAEGPRFRLVRSVSGSKGTPQGGRLSVEDPRSVFFIPEDHQVIVYMEWEGPVGKHHIEGFWKSPSGKPSVFTDFDYDTKEKRFGAFFTFTLADEMEIGTWTLEAHVDGEQAGSHSFQITNGRRPADAIPARKSLTASQLYDHAIQSAVVIEALDRSGQRFRAGSGFLMEPDWIVTAFENIDGATRLRLTYSDNTRFETDQIISWNRRQDWAILRANPTKLTKLQRAPADSWSVGDTAFYLNTELQGNVVIAEVSIDGKNTFPGSGMRMSISLGPAERSIGACLLNEYADVIAIVGGAIIPGARAINFLDWTSPSPGSKSAAYVMGGLAVPIAMIPAVPAERATTSLSVLDAGGQFLPPVTASRDVVYGQLARTLNTKGGLPYPAEGGDSFSKRDPRVHVYVMWEGREKVKGFVSMRIYDIENHLLDKEGVDKPTKLSLGSGEQKVTTWAIPTASLTAGIYRVDVWLNDAPAWRSFLKLSD